MITYALLEDYLEELFPPWKATGRTLRTAERLKITKGDGHTVQKLVDQGFLNHERSGSLHLTDSAEERGLVVFRRALSSMSSGPGRRTPPDKCTKRETR